jgi:hypothetical protein
MYMCLVNVYDTLLDVCGDEGVQGSQVMDSVLHHCAGRSALAF